MKIVQSKSDWMLREVWKKARREGKVEIDFAEQLVAQRIRFALYRATKEAREGASGDEELDQAARGVIMTLRKVAVPSVRLGAPSPHFWRLVLESKDVAEGMSAVAEALGLNLADVKTPEEREAEELGQRMLEKLKGGGE